MEPSAVRDLSKTASDDSEADILTLPYTGEHMVVLHRLSLVEGQIMTHNGTVFDTVAYSRFKYGAPEAYTKFLSEELMRQLEPVIRSGEPIVVTGTAYKRVPNASYWLAINVYRHLKAAGLNVTYGKIYRSRLTEGDYGTMSQSERELKTAQKGMSIDTHEFEGRHVVVAEDIRITGSIERSTMEFLARQPIKSVTMAYVAIMDAEVARTNPRIEHQLNHTAIGGLEDLWLLMCERPGYRFNARTVKFVLEAAPDAVSKFVATLAVDAPWYLDQLQAGIIDDGYNQMARYQATAEIISSVVLNQTS